MKHSMLRLTFATSLLWAAGAAHADDRVPGMGGVEWNVKVKAAGYGEGDRDLGATDPAAPASADSPRSTAAFVDLQPSLYAPFGTASAFYTRVQLFGATGDKVIQNEGERPVASESYAALRELWFEWGGISDFPGEKARLGLQRVRESSGQWYDRDIESGRWIFDSTLVQADIGVGEQFNTYRTDDVRLSPNQKKRRYLWLGLDRQWRPGYTVGARGMYATDYGDLPKPGTTIDADTKTQSRDFLWVGLHTGNGYYDPRTTSAVQYWFEGIGMHGRRQSAQTFAGDPADPANPPNPTLVVGQRDDRVSALAGDAGLRLRIPTAQPVLLGVHAAYAQGGPGDPRAGTSNTFQPTGLESNRSRFTGTRALISRFNEALQANWSNLADVAGYFSLPGESMDFSLVYHKLRRDSGDVGFSADGIDARPVNGSVDIGQGVDIVVSKYLARTGGTAATDADDTRSNLRLRASQFMPGKAYGDDATHQYRVMLETTLWF